MLFHTARVSGFECAADDQGEGCRDAMRQMLHCLTQVADLWKDILPARVYCKAVGECVAALSVRSSWHYSVSTLTLVFLRWYNCFRLSAGSLLNAAVGEIIDNIISITEFSADDCDVLQKVGASMATHSISK